VIAPVSRRRPGISRAWRRLCARVRHADRGEGVIEFAVLALPLLTVTFIVAQAGFVFYARSMALAGAIQGANAARAYGGDSTAGRDKARDFLSRVGWGLENPVVTVTSNGTEVTVVVTGTTQTIIPGVSFTVTQRAHGPVERFVR
jgi:Flp pilus assembly protein TadG